MLDITKINQLASLYEETKQRELSRIYSTINFDEKAHKFIIEIKQNELYQFFFNTIQNSLRSKNYTVEEYIENKKDSLYSDFFDSEIEEQIQHLKKNISRNWREDKWIYKDASAELGKLEYNDEVELIELITQKAISEFNAQFRSIHKIIYLANFTNKINNSILFSELFKGIDNLNIFNPSELEKLFISKTAFYHVIKLLEFEQIITKIGSHYYWKGGINDPEIKPKKSLCCLFINLNNKNYLKETKPNSVVKAVNAFFKNEKFSLTLYIRYMEEFSNIDSRNNSKYFKYYHFIK